MLNVQQQQQQQQHNLLECSCSAFETNISQADFVMEPIQIGHCMQHQATTRQAETGPHIKQHLHCVWLQGCSVVALQKGQGSAEGGH